jgi:hypothetical protein
MSSLNIENLTKEVIREIVLERFFSKQAVRNLEQITLTIPEESSVSRKSSPSYTWETSNRKTLLDIPVGEVKYISFPRNMKRVSFRQKWLRARHSLRRIYGADFVFTNTLTALKVERVA